MLFQNVLFRALGTFFTSYSFFIFKRTIPFINQYVYLPKRLQIYLLFFFKIKFLLNFLTNVSKSLTNGKILQNFPQTKTPSLFLMKGCFIKFTFSGIAALSSAASYSSSSQYHISTRLNNHSH